MTTAVFPLRDQILALLQETPDMGFTAAEVNDCLDRDPSKGSVSAINFELLSLVRDGLICRDEGQSTDGRTPFVYWWPTVDGRELPIHMRKPQAQMSPEEMAHIRLMYQVLCNTSAEQKTKYQIMCDLYQHINVHQCFNVAGPVIDEMVRSGLLYRRVVHSVSHISITRAGEAFLDRWYPHFGPVRSPK